MNNFQNILTEQQKKRREACSYIQERIPFMPDYAIILGTGLGQMVNKMTSPTVLDYKDIPHFPLSTVETHKGHLILGYVHGKKVAALQGRFHYYEGYNMQQIVFPLQVLHNLGAHTLFVSNACGGLNRFMKRGDIMLIEDHINLFGSNPLIGPNDDSLGSRFPDMIEPYSKKLIELALSVAQKLNIYVHQGVYCGLAGPMLETRAEYRFLKTIGGDVVGMSTIPEVISAVHMGMEVLGISIITDECIPDALKPVSFEEITTAANEAEPKLTQLMEHILKIL